MAKDIKIFEEHSNFLPDKAPHSKTTNKKAQTQEMERDIS